ncbi:hypothetical protein [Jidongwangia harbinensis]|uniref:hypothetical protein n=1 Tax=Jidongwangia harbinensis TaxID=2878561 RepID=UPI001CDA0245|nr:hypothetical protein [Jidongwangia harbinensis]MCA2218016.1 hypothetical protein [Jidongwangia harbinensis]
MTTFPGAARPVRGGIILLDPATSRIQRIIALQYNPDNLSRTLQAQGAGDDPGDRLEALRLKGPPTETIRLEADMDATDALEFPRQNPTVAELGLFPALAALETMVYPPSGQLIANDVRAAAGMIEIVPVEAPLTLFTWSRNRLLPVRLTEFTVTEEAFDTNLNPIRARVNLSMRVLTVNDLGFSHRGGSLYLLHQQQKERFAGMGGSPGLAALGFSGIPGGG